MSYLQAMLTLVGALIMIFLVLPWIAMGYPYYLDWVHGFFR
jgi:hypothetical protein